MLGYCKTAIVGLIPALSIPLASIRPVVGRPLDVRDTVVRSHHRGPFPAPGCVTFARIARDAPCWPSPSGQATRL